MLSYEVTMPGVTAQLDARFKAINDFETKQSSVGKTSAIDGERPSASVGVAWEVAMHQSTAAAPGRSSRLQFIDVLERLKASGELKAIQESYSSQQTLQGSTAGAGASRPSYAAAAGKNSSSQETFGSKLSSGALIMQHPQTPPRPMHGRGRGRSRGGGRAGGRTGRQAAPAPLVPSSVTVASAGGKPTAMNIADIMDDHVAAFNSFMAQFQPGAASAHAVQEAVPDSSRKGYQGAPAVTSEYFIRPESMSVIVPADSLNGTAEVGYDGGAEGGADQNVTPPRQHGSLISKLNSPDRLRVDAGTTAARTAARHAQAEANRAKLEQERQARLRQKANKVRQVSERAAAMRSTEKYTQAELRLMKATQRHRAHLQTIKQRASSENRKVGEVEFINSMNREGKVADMLAAARSADARRTAHIEQVRSKAGGVAARASQVAGATAAATQQATNQRSQAMQQRLSDGAERRANVLQERASRASSDVGRSDTPPGRKVYGVDGQSQVTSYEKSPPRLALGGKKQRSAATLKPRGAAQSYAAALSASGGSNSASIGQTAPKAAAPSAPSALQVTVPVTSAPALPPAVKRVHKTANSAGGAAAGSGSGGHTKPVQHTHERKKQGGSKQDAWSGVSSAVTSLVLTGELASPTPTRPGSRAASQGGEAESKVSDVGTSGFAANKLPAAKAATAVPRAKGRAKSGKGAAASVDELNLQDLDALLQAAAKPVSSPKAAKNTSSLALFHLSGLGLRPDAQAAMVAPAAAALKSRHKRARKTRGAIFAAAPVTSSKRAAVPLRPRVGKLLSAVTSSVVLNRTSLSAQESPLLSLACPLPTALPASIASLLQALDASGSYCEATATLPEAVLGATFELQQAFDASDDGTVVSEFHGPQGGAGGFDETGGGGSSAVSLRMTSSEADCLRTSGALRVAASVCTAAHMESQPGLLVPALRLLLLGCALPSNCDYLLAHGLMVPVVDVLGAALDRLPLRDMGLLAHMQPGSVSDALLKALGQHSPVQQEHSFADAPPVDAVARDSEGIAVTMASLQVLWLLFRHAAQRKEANTGEGAPLAAQVQRLVQYIVHSSVLVRLAMLVELLRDAPTLVAFSPLLRTVLAFFVALLNAHPRQQKPISSGGALSAAGDVLCCQVMSTGCLEVPSLLVALLLAVSPRSRTRNHSRQRDSGSSPRSIGTPGSSGFHGHRRSDSGAAAAVDAVSSIPHSALATAVLALKVVNAACRLDIGAVQGLLDDPALRSSVFHALEHLLSHAAHGMGFEAAGARQMDTTEEAVWETTLLVGYLCFNNPSHAQMLRWGPPPTPIQRLATLPFRYFSQHPYTAVLMPTLVAACAADASNLAIVTKHCSPELLLSFLEAHAQGKGGTAAGTSVVHASGVRLTPFAGFPAAVSEPLLQALLPPLPPVYQPKQRLDLRPAAVGALRAALQAQTKSSTEAGVVSAPAAEIVPDFDAMD